MSQTTVLKLLRETGPATTKQLAILAKKRYPDLSLHTYIGNRLNQLHKWGIVNKDAKGVWHIVEGST